MKTTMNLPDALVSAVKQQAAAERRTVASFTEHELRAHLAERSRVQSEPVSLPNWSGGSAKGYLVDIEDKSALWAVRALSRRP